MNSSLVENVSLLQADRAMQIHNRLYETQMNCSLLRHSDHSTISMISLAIEHPKTIRFTNLLQIAAKACAACTLPPDLPPPEAEPQSLA